MDRGDKWMWCLLWGIGIIGVGCIIAACIPGIDAGIVEAKWEEAAHTQTDTSYVIVGGGQYGGGSALPISSSKHVPPTWWVKIESGGDTNTIQVSRAQYDDIRVGEFYRSGAQSSRLAHAE